MGLSIGPRRRSRWPLIVVVGLGVVAGLAFWRQGAWPAALTLSLPRRLATPAGAAVATAPLTTRATAVARRAGVPAYTAELYLADTERAAETEGAAWTQTNARTAVLSYTVEEGDTLWNIAAQFGLDVDTLRWSNPDLERNPDLLPVGTELVILPVSGVYHTVAEGDTVESVAARYGVAEADIINYPLNQLRFPYTLTPGQQIIVPHGRKEINLPPPSPAEGYPLAWPVVGTVTQGYSAGHRALDIGAAYGARVYASEAGTVIRADWARTGYGFTVIIDHGQNRRTLYSHLKGALVTAGQQVARGEVIGEIGSTGNSTGPHVHFEVRESGKRLDPAAFLPPGSPR